MSFKYSFEDVVERKTFFPRGWNRAAIGKCELKEDSQSGVVQLEVTFYSKEHEMRGYVTVYQPEGSASDKAISYNRRKAALFCESALSAKGFNDPREFIGKQLCIQVKAKHNDDSKDVIDWFAKLDAFESLKAKELLQPAAEVQAAKSDMTDIPF